MDRAEKFIQDYTRNCSNEYLGEGKSDGHGGTISKKYFTPWLTPDQARKAVEIAREEIYEWLNENFSNYFEARMSMFKNCLDDLKNSLKK